MQNAQGRARLALHSAFSILHFAFDVSMLVLLVAPLLLLVAAVVWGARAIAQEIVATREAGVRGRALQLLGVLAPAIGAADADPRALLAWQPVVKTARQLFPGEFVELDRAAGATFPFSADRIEAAHARWTADWLGWERTHDAEYRLKAATEERDLEASGGSPLARARLEAVEREKLERYQRRYEEYVRVAKALQALLK